MFSTHSSFLSTRFSVYFVCAAVVVVALHFTLLQDTTSQLVYEYWLSCACAARDTRAQETRISVCMEEEEKMNVLLLENSSKHSSRCVRCHSTDCTSVCAATRDRRLLLLQSHTQALVLFHSDTRHATDDAHLFTPPGVFVCVAVDVLKFPFEFGVRSGWRIARCVAFRMLHQYWKWVLGRWRYCTYRIKLN